MQKRCLWLFVSIGIETTSVGGNVVAAVDAAAPCSAAAGIKDTCVQTLGEGTAAETTYQQSGALNQREVTNQHRPVHFYTRYIKMGLKPYKDLRSFQYGLVCKWARSGTSHV